MKPFYILLIGLTLYTNHAIAQIQLHKVKEYGSEELSSNLFNKIVQDSYGFIWIATDYGLNKFDGFKFVQYLNNRKDHTSLLSNNIKTLTLDKKGNLWVGCNSGLQLYDPALDSFKTISFPDSLTPYISEIREIHNGEIWVTTAGRGTFLIDRTTLKAKSMTVINQIAGYFPGSIYEDRHKMLWISTNKKLLRIDPSLKKYTSFSQFNNNVSGFVEDRQGRLFMSTSNYVYYMNDGSQTFIPIEKTEVGLSIRGLIKSKKGIIYLATDGQGLKYIDTKQNKILPVSIGESPYDLKRTKIQTIFEDRDSNLWLGCFSKGILVIPNESPKFKFWPLSGNEYQMGNTPISICKDHNENIWCAVENEGIIKLNNKGAFIKHLNTFDDITKIYEDSHKKLWITSYKHGLGVLNEKSEQCNFMNITSTGYMKTMVEGRDDHLYISTFGSGFMRYNLNTGKWVKYEMNQKNKSWLGNDWINCILCDSQGLIWLGHYKGVSCFDPDNNRFIDLKQQDILSKQICISLMESRDGKIWIGTYNGLFCLDKKTKNVKNYTIDDGLYSNVICGLAEDGKGNIWCSTFRGINLLRRLSNQIICFYQGNGLEDKTYNRDVYWQDPNGLIFFGGNKGITSFDPSQMTFNKKYSYTVLITSLYAHSQPVTANTQSGGKNIVSSNVLNSNVFHFSYEDNTFTFEFSTMDFKDPENIYFQYRIKELSNIWNSTKSGVNQVAYSHLDPGKYTMEVRACKYESISQIKTITIIISPPWYKSKVAYFIYILLVSIFVLFSFYLIRKKRREIINEFRLQSFIYISHEIRSPLTLIINPIKKLLKEDLPPNIEKTIQGVYRNSNRMLGLVDQLLDVRKIDQGKMKLKYRETDLVSFINDVYNIFEIQAQERGISFNFSHQTEFLLAWIDQNNFDKIIINILSNAFKFTPDKGEISINLTSGNYKTRTDTLFEYAEITITDSGMGIDEDKKDKIFDKYYQSYNRDTFGEMGYGIGLNLAKMLVQLHHGSIRVENLKDKKGCRFSVRIPLGKNHLKKEDLIETFPQIISSSISNLPEKDEPLKSFKRKTKYKILVIDDEEEMINYLQNEFKDAYKVLTANDGTKGLQTALFQMPDLIISDVLMPQMDGFTLVKKLRSNSNICHIPIILLTSKIDFEDRIEGLNEGADAYLTKPFDLEELSLIMKNLINSRSFLKSKYSGMQDQSEKVIPVEFKSSDETFMEQIMAIINKNISNPQLNVAMLMADLRLSRVHLHRKIKMATGLSAGNFIRSIRLRQAAILLKEKKIDISQIAYAVGFSSQTHFSTAFKNFYGVSPSEYITQKNQSFEPNDTNEKT
ncbi:MAG: tmoS 12 [Bacteroidetes bacterium]|jgi:ligand-binding sensor domain-containing protein/DNA-binding response OmpR family regulator|nr:tmoS 12 [Bacteroidota bacterium]